MFQAHSVGLQNLKLVYAVFQMFDLEQQYVILESSSRK